MNGIICLHGYPEIVKVFSTICAALIAICAIVITALIIPENIFTFGEIWGIVVHRYQVIVFGGIIVCYPAYRAAEFCFCWRCPVLSGKTEPRYGFPYIV